MERQQIFETELKAAERRFNWRLPTSYRTFVLAADEPAAQLHTPRRDLEPARLAANREYADFLLKASKADYALAGADVVFLVHEGFQFWFFRCDDGDDPAVYRFSEGEQRPSKVAPSLSAWFATLRSGGAQAEAMEPLAQYCF
jgi:SMI1 / KNR4 family (SUKH-1)